MERLEVYPENLRAGRLGAAAEGFQRYANAGETGKRLRRADNSHDERIASFGRNEAAAGAVAFWINEPHLIALSGGRGYEIPGKYCQQIPLLIHQHAAGDTVLLEGKSLG